MRSLSTALRRVGTEAQVPVPWLDLARRIQPLRGNLVNVLAEPGVGKSALALNWCVQAEQPTCLLSLDTDLATQAIRMASILSEVPMVKVKQDPIVWADYLDHKANYVRAYDLPLESREMFGLLEAETEYWVPPQLSRSWTTLGTWSVRVRSKTIGAPLRTYIAWHGSLILASLYSTTSRELLEPVRSLR